MGEIDNQYLCKECIVKSKVINKSELTLIINNLNKNKNKNQDINSDWLNEEDKLELLDNFIEFEKEDMEIVQNIEMLKAKMFKKDLEKGLVNMSERELFNYMNFYGNNPEIVFQLRDILRKGSKNKFLKDIYVQARTRKLSYRQVETIKRNRAFAYLEANLEEFWEYVPVLLYAIENDYFEEGEKNKIKEILTSIIKDEFFTEKQKFVIEQFISKNMDKLNNNKITSKGEQKENG